MSEQRAQQLIVGCLAASAAVAAGSSLAEGEAPGIRMAVGFAFTGVGLATVSMFAPDLAGAFSVLILTSTVFLYGGPFMESVTSLTRAPRARSTTTRTPPTTNKETPA